MPVLTTTILAAAVSAVVSSLFALVGTHLERTSRRKELLLTKAIELAEHHVDTFASYAKDSGKPVQLAPIIVQIRWFHSQLQSLYSKERLSADMEETFKTYIELGKLKR